MRNFTLSAYLGALFILLISSCGKLKDDGVKNLPPNVNPNVATLDDGFVFKDTTLTNHGWTKIFDDDFSGDLSQWNLLNGGVPKELGCYQASNVTLSGGILSIAAKKEAVTGPTVVGASSQSNFDFSTGWIVSKRSFTLTNSEPKIHIVGRIKVATGNGLTSVLYTFGGNWPVNGEIDFLQVLGNRTDRYFTDYSYGTEPLKNLVTDAQYFNPTNGNLSAGYHVFELEWTISSLKTYLDGKLVESKTNGNHIGDLFGKVQYLSMNLPVGGLYYPSIDPASVNSGVMSVDYIKVYSSK